MAAPAEQPVVRFENVSVYFDDLRVLDDVSFEIAEGQTCVILGSAGSGKSVLLKTALGLIKPGAGRISLFGQDVTHLSESRWYDVRARIGVLFQEGALFDSLTIEENVSYPLLNQRGRLQKPDPGVREKVVDSLRFVELEHTLDKFPSELSGGMRRRVGIARANVTAPPLCLYDSPTAGLDPITANTIISLIVKARDVYNTTSAIVTHRFQDGHLLANFRYNPDSGNLVRATEEVQSRAKFLVLKEGRLVFSGSEQELESSADPYISKFVLKL